MRTGGMAWPGASASRTQRRLLATLSRRLSFSPAWMRRVKPSFSPATFTSAWITGRSSRMSLISSPRISLPAT